MNTLHTGYPAPEQALQSLWARAPELSDEARALRESEVSQWEYGKWRWSR